MSDKLVKLEALVWHTGYGDHHEPGDVYELDEQDAANVVAQGKARRVETEEAAPKRKASKPVEPMTTEDFKPKSK